MRSQSMQNISAVIVEVHSHLFSLEFLRYLGSAKQKTAE